MTHLLYCLRQLTRLVRTHYLSILPYLTGRLTEPISLAAKFTTIVADDKPPKITFAIPEFINKAFDVLPKIIEKNPDYVKYYLDGEERELEQLPLRF